MKISKGSDIWIRFFISGNTQGGKTRVGDVEMLKPWHHPSSLQGFSLFYPILIILMDQLGTSITITVAWVDRRNSQLKEIEKIPLMIRFCSPIHALSVLGLTKNKIRFNSFELLSKRYISSYWVYQNFILQWILKNSLVDTM